MTQQYFLSPITYAGSKRRLMPSLIPLLPQVDTFIDVFAGSCAVGLNAPADKIVFNDCNDRIIELLSWLSTQDTDTLIQSVDQVIADYGLSNARYGVVPPVGVRRQDFNKPGYLKLRQDYNNDKSQLLLLYVISIFSFSGMIRFNSSGDFNVSVGDSEFGKHGYKKLTSYMNRIQQVDCEFHIRDFHTTITQELDREEDVLFYCDPPYLHTTAVYNENGGWGVDQENQLLSDLDHIHASGKKFALSNVIESKGKTNDILLDWVNNHAETYTVHELSMTYHNASYNKKDRSSVTREVLVTNF